MKSWFSKKNIEKYIGIWIIVAVGMAVGAVGFMSGKFTEVWAKIRGQ
jgi:hypothetical protein